MLFENLKTSGIPKKIFLSFHCYLAARLEVFGFLSEPLIFIICLKVMETVINFLRISFQPSRLQHLKEIYGNDHSNEKRKLRINAKRIEVDFFFFELRFSVQKPSEAICWLFLEMF
jgi:hypothetical protein